MEPVDKMIEPGISRILTIQFSTDTQVEIFDGFQKPEARRIKIIMDRSRNNQRGIHQMLAITANRTDAQNEAS